MDIGRYIIKKNALGRFVVWKRLGENGIALCCFFDLKYDACAWALAMQEGDGDEDA